MDSAKIFVCRLFRIIRTDDMEGAMDSGAELEGNFDSWLKQLLDSHDVDGEVFGEYISGTLSTIEDPTGDEITENLSDILSGCVVCM